MKKFSRFWLVLSLFALLAGSFAFSAGEVKAADTYIPAGVEVRLQA